MAIGRIDCVALYTPELWKTSGRHKVGTDLPWLANQVVQWCRSIVSRIAASIHWRLTGLITAEFSVRDLVNSDEIGSIGAEPHKKNSDHRRRQAFEKSSCQLIENQCLWRLKPCFDG